MAALSPDPDAPAPLRVLLIEDEELLAEGVARVVGDSPRLVVVDRVRCDDVALTDRVDRSAPDVVLVEAAAGERPADAVPAVLLEPGRPPVALLTSRTDERSLLDALRLGCAGYAIRSVSGPDLVSVLERAAADPPAVDPSLASRLAVAASRLPPDRLWPGLSAGLTERESQALQLLADGHSNAQIATTLYLGEETVRSHLRTLYRKLGARDRADAVAIAFRQGLVA